jgi:hypothetical protein
MDISSASKHSLKALSMHRAPEKTWEMGDGRWEMGISERRMGDGRWVMGDGG